MPVSLDAQEKTKNIMFLEELKIIGNSMAKQETGFQLNANGNKMQDRQVGWFVGFISKGNQVITFTYLIADNKKQKTFARIRAKAALKMEIEGLIKELDGNF